MENTIRTDTGFKGIEPATLNENMDAVVGRYFYIESVTRGPNDARSYLGGPSGSGNGSAHPKNTATDVIARYSGHLYSDDSAAAYDQMSAQLKPLGATPLFRKDHGEQVIVLIPALPEVRPSNPIVNIVLYVLTVASVFYVGYLTSNNNIGEAVAYTAALLGILTAHEFGHYLVGRYHKAAVSPPYFIPLPPPLSFIGTMGAVIMMKAPPKNRRTLLDIGIAGPLAGLIVAIPVLLIGLSLSPVSPLTVPAGGVMMEGNSILYLLAKFAVFHQLLPAPASYAGLNPLVYWVRYFFTGQPFPLGGLDVNLHPVAWAGWVGILVTALNLVPAGQLDGGHMLYVLFGSRGARRVLPFILGAMVLLGFAWNGWWLWAALVFFLVGRTYAEPLDQITPLDTRRKVLAVFALVIFVIVFTPVPFLEILPH
jgi:membrane-associated protease RseP (regulator of RpoE activity)